MEVGGRPIFGEMEKAFSTKIRLLLDEFFAGRLIVDFYGRPSRTTEPRRKRKRGRRSGNRVWGLWNSLPSELLVSIMMKLSIIDYFAFSGVSRQWRYVSIDFRKYYLERQQPLVVVRPTSTKRGCILYNMFDGKSYKAMLPDLRCRRFVGLSCGYLITVDKNMGVWLVNLMTRHELWFPVLPKNLSYVDQCYIRAVLFQSTRLSRVLMVLFCSKQNWLLLSESGSNDWQEYLLPNTSGGISDVKIFDSKIFVLTCNALLGEFNPRADPFLKLCNTNIRIESWSNMSLQLVTSDNKLYMIISHRPGFVTLDKYLAFWEVDHKKMECVKQIHDLGAKSLFMSTSNSAVVDTTGWGGGNCVCLLQNFILNKWSFFHLNGNNVATAPVVWDAPLYESYFWFFANESCEISCVGDEFGM